MARRWRVRRVAKWVTTLWCVTLISVALISPWCEGRWRHLALSDGYELELSIAHGDVILEYAVYDDSTRSGWAADGEKPTSSFDVTRAQVPGFWYSVPFSQFKSSISDGSGRIYGYSRWATVSIWLAIPFFGLPALFLWWLDRRRVPPGHCRRCDYDLTGNVSGRCPECGAAMQAATLAARDRTE